MLRLENVCASYGRTPILEAIDLEVREAEFVTLVGANGAGKTTMLRAISGTIPMRSGRFTFRGRDISDARPGTIVRAGLTHSPEGRGVFPMMTVYENLQVGGHLLTSARQVRSGIEKIFEYFPRLFERRDQLAGHLSGGEQQMLAIGRALMPSPKLLLLDEPSLGLSPMLVNQVVSIVSKLHAEGLAVLLVEQNARLALSLADKGCVLESGRIVLRGKGSDLLNDRTIVDAYLGGNKGARDG
ncbi:ABC transporter ATP-binding protein [Tardiphaga sp. 866_E4_N2_1]|uniref:ABC transporter ATP-binding protein n=1 Tax=unclassified Tardiphaga TaxID=2631404 RepID=UPI003F28580C